MSTKKTSRKKTAIIIDDHPLFSKSLETILLDLGYSEVFLEKSGQAGISAAKSLCPDLVTIDIELPDLSGFDIVKACKPLCLESLFIFISMHEDHLFAHRARDFGADAYIAKSEDEEEIKACIQLAQKDKFHVSKSINENLKSYSSGIINQPLVKDEPDFSVLTDQEKNILYLLQQGKTSKEIGGVLEISHRTVQNHRSNICNKLNLNGPNALLKIAVEHVNILLNERKMKQ